MTPEIHFMFVTFPGQGHMKPFLELAKLVAAKGVLVTVASTASIGRMISNSSSDDNSGSSAVPVGDGALRFEYFSDGLDDVPDVNRIPIEQLMGSLNTFGPAAFAALVRRQTDEGRPPVSCIVSNPFLAWAVDVAAELDIPTAVLWVQSCAVFSIYHHYHTSPDDFSVSSVNLPGLPPLSSDELPTFLLPNCIPSLETLKKTIMRQFENISKATWVLANSFEELEPEAATAIQELILPITLVGPLVGGPGPKISGDLYRPAADECIGWLDKQEPRSVVYVSVGSVATVGEEEMREMAFGLRRADKPFLWVVRDDMAHLLPEGFEVGGRGLVVRWSPQERVLRHGAVGCFLTHCGWNSTLESLAAGVPVIAFPRFGDQVTDAKFLVEVYGVGVRLGSPVTREEVARCVEAATVVAIRERAEGWRKATEEAVAAGGSSDRNIQALVDEVRNKVVMRRSISLVPGKDVGALEAKA